MRTIMFDIDGILLDNMSIYLEVLRENHGINKTAEDLRCWNLEEALGLPREIINDAYKYMTDNKLHEVLKPVKDIEKWYHNICGLFDVVVHYTNRHLLNAQQTRNCSDKYNFRHNQLIFSDLNYGKVNAGFDVAVEDNLDCAIQLRLSGCPKVYLLDYKYNRSKIEYEGIIRFGVNTDEPYKELWEILKNG